MGKMVENGLRYADWYEVVDGRVVVHGEFQRWQDDALLPAGVPFAVKFVAHGLPMTVTYSAILPDADRNRRAMTSTGLPPPSGLPEGSLFHDMSTMLPAGPGQAGSFGFGAFDRMPPTGGGGGGGGNYQHASVLIELFAPGETAAVHRVYLPAITGALRQNVEINPLGMPTPDSWRRRAGWFRVVMTVDGGQQAVAAYL